MLTPINVIPDATPDGEILVTYLNEINIPVNKLIRKGDPLLDELKPFFDDIKARKEAIVPKPVTVDVATEVVEKPIKVAVDVPIVEAPDPAIAIIQAEEDALKSKVFDLAKDVP